MYKQPVTDEAVEAVKGRFDSGMRLRPSLAKTCDEFDCGMDALTDAFVEKYPDLY